MKFAPEKILCAVDMSSVSHYILRWADLIGRTFAAQVKVLYIDWWEPPPYFTHSQIQNLAEQSKAHQTAAHDQLKAMVSEAISSEVEVSTEIAQGHPATTILEHGRMAGSEVIIMGSHGRTGLARFRLGSVSEDVVHRAKSPVLIVKNQEQSKADPKISRLLCPVNFTELSRESLELSSELAAAFHARLLIVHAVEREGADREGIFEELCTWIPDRIRTACEVREIVREGNAAEQIVLLAREEEADLIVIGAEQRPFLDLARLGTTAERVMRYSPVSVLVAPLSLHSKP